MRAKTIKSEWCSLRFLCELGEFCVEPSSQITAAAYPTQSSQSTERSRKGRVKRAAMRALTAALILGALLSSVALPGPPVDWSKGVVDTLIKKNPTGESWKGWGYAK